MRDLSWPHDPELTEEEAVSIAADLLNRFNLPYYIVSTERVGEIVEESFPEHSDDKDRLVGLVTESDAWFSSLADSILYEAAEREVEGILSDIIENEDSYEDEENS